MRAGVALVSAALLVGTAPGLGSPSQAAKRPRLGLQQVRVAQTHVLTPRGLRWTPDAAAPQSLTVVGRRSMLVLVRFRQAKVSTPQLQVWIGGTKKTTLDLNKPGTLPATEDDGVRLAGKTWWVNVPGRLVRPGLKLSAVAEGYSGSAKRSVVVGADTTLRMRVLPFYLFGATAAGAGTSWAEVRTASAAVRRDLTAVWPVKKLDLANHPAQRVKWRELVVAPRLDDAGIARPAYVLTGVQQQRDAAAVSSSVLTVLSGLRAANGEGPTNTQYYAPVLAADSATGQMSLLGSAMGGSGAAVGDASYAGAFLHEQGHAFGLGHAGEEYTSGSFPYPGGSLAGSAWGYDQRRGEFLSPQVPASRLSRCATGHQTLGDGTGCWKQDPMQGGDGDQVTERRFTMFSDLNAARLQRWLQGGPTTRASDGTYTYDGGRVFLRGGSPTGYARWNTLTGAWDPATPTTTSSGIDGPDGGLPLERNVPVASIVTTRSNAGTNGATRVYEPLTYTGNAVRTFDPTVAADRAAIDPDGSDLSWYCRATGCDYTARVTLAGGRTRHVVLQGGFKSWWQWTGADRASSLDPLSADSQRTWVVNVPTEGRRVTKVELLATPHAWSATTASVAAAPALATWTP